MLFALERLPEAGLEPVHRAPPMESDPTVALLGSNFNSFNAADVSIPLLAGCERLVAAGLDPVHRPLPHLPEHTRECGPAGVRSSRGRQARDLELLPVSVKAVSFCIPRVWSGHAALEDGAWFDMRIIAYLVTPCFGGKLMKVVSCVLRRAHQSVVERVGLRCHLLRNVKPLWMQ